MAMEIFGIDRNRTYTREEICLRYGYDPEGMPDKTAQDKELRRSEKNNRDRFFREHFLKRNLLAVPVGKSYEVSGELYFAWTMANSRPCAKDDSQVQTG
jgi:hypothetical protein